MAGPQTELTPWLETARSLPEDRSGCSCDGATHTRRGRREYESMSDPISDTEADRLQLRALILDILRLRRELEIVKRQRDQLSRRIETCLQEVAEMRARMEENRAR